MMISSERKARANPTLTVAAASYKRFDGMTTTGSSSGPNAFFLLFFHILSVSLANCPLLAPFCLQCSAVP